MNVNAHRRAHRNNRKEPDMRTAAQLYNDHREEALALAKRLVTFLQEEPTEDGGFTFSHAKTMCDITAALNKADELADRLT